MTCFVVISCRGKIGEGVARFAWSSMVFLLKGPTGGFFEDALV